MGEPNEFLVDDQVIKKNKLKGITEMILNLNELDNSDNLKDERSSNKLSCEKEQRFYAFQNPYPTI